ncbi:MAG: hypothetical protein H5U38_09365 [Calditrichaeota bacterium]|nr:hypothetical protein [Calditrichota bacterium]
MASSDTTQGQVNKERNLPRFHKCATFALVGVFAAGWSLLLVTIWHLLEGRAEWEAALCASFVLLLCCMTIWGIVRLNRED